MSSLLQWCLCSSTCLPLEVDLLVTSLSYRDALGELDVLGHVGTGVQRLGQPLPDVLLAPPRQRPQPVERLPGDDPDQVGPRVAHLCAVDVGPPQPGLLDHVLGVSRRAEHLVGDGEEQAAVGEERVSSLMKRTLLPALPTARPAAAGRTPPRSRPTRCRVPRCPSW